ncbi:hypothetical protein CRV24_007749 [Beauveria bassiana]|nr:hypothetical protein CRV24_007749 [Beauveria bassiana]KAH8715791.1 hypothetical protein HC256_004583 [Beauveria bassiana]
MTCVVAALRVAAKPPIIPSPRQVRISALAQLRERERVLDTAAALEHVRIVGRGVTLTDDVGRAELELSGQRGGAAPLDVLVAVRGALVGAAHHVNGVEAAEGARRDAPELRHGRDAAVRRLGAAAAERQRLHRGEEHGGVGWRGPLLPLRGHGGGGEPEGEDKRPGEMHDSCVVGCAWGKYLFYL